MKKIMSAILAAAALISCTDNDPKILILYYSQTGATEAVAKEIHNQTGADMLRFDVAQVYDGDFDATIQRCLQEQARGFVPTLNPIDADLSEYDVIFLGYPIWFGTYAPPVKALISSVDLSGKKIVPFCTFGSGGLEASVKVLTANLENCTVAPGFGIRKARVQYAAEELDRFLIESGYKEGTLEPLEPYSESREMTEEEVAIYHEAVDSYPIPIGEPVSVASRPVTGGTDYAFAARSADPEGNVRENTVYVITREGRSPEFTRVNR